MHETLHAHGQYHDSIPPKQFHIGVQYIPIFLLPYRLILLYHEFHFRTSVLFYFFAIHLPPVEEGEFLLYIMLNLLKGGRLSAGEICEHFSVTGASISRHLAILKDADLISSKNSEFVALLKQANTDISKIAEAIGVSDAQLRFVTNSQSGMGLLKCGNVVIPFDNQIERIQAFIYLFYSLSDIFSEMAHTIENSIDLNSLKLQ